MKVRLSVPMFCLAMCAGLANAQSNVTVYGVADTAVQSIRTTTGTITGLNSGARGQSRLGFRGTEDLGGGTNAFFTLEQGILLDLGTLGQGGRGYGRQAFVGMSGSWGTLAAGRIALFSSGTGSFDMIGDVDPLLSGYGIAGVGSSLSSASGLRGDNSILYRTPTMAGFQAGIIHSFQLTGSEVAPTSANMHATALGMKYRVGPLLAVATFDTFNNPAGGPDEKHLHVGAVYDAQVVQLYAAYGREKNLFSTSLNVSGTTNGAGATGYMVGATVPLGSGIVRMSYQARNGEARGGEDRDLNVKSLAYEYRLSKRTLLYTAFSESDGRKTLDKTDPYDRRVISLGMSHSF